jgi:hypothetical protein
MSTRESMRRELRELAKLAEAKRQEQSKTPRSSGEWSYVDPADAPTPAPPPEMADESVLGTAEPIDPLDPPSWPSSATVPPVVPQAGSPSVPGDVETSPRAPSARRASRWLMVGIAAVVLVGAGVVGRKLHGTPAQAAAAAAAPAVQPPAAEAPAPPPGGPAPTVPAPSDPAPALAAAAAATLPSNPASRRSAIVAPRPAKALHAAPVPAKALAQAKPAAATGPAASHADSLDDLMRKAVSSGSK